MPRYYRNPVWKGMVMIGFRNRERWTPRCRIERRNGERWVPHLSTTPIMESTESQETVETVRGRTNVNLHKGSETPPAGIQDGQYNCNRRHAIAIQRVQFPCLFPNSDCQSPKSAKFRNVPLGTKIRVRHIRNYNRMKTPIVRVTELC